MVLAWLIGVFAVESGDEGRETPAELLAYFENDEVSIYIGAVCFFAGSAALIWFGGVLRTTIAATGLDRLASIVFGAAVAISVLSMSLVAPNVSGAFAANESDSPLTPEAAQALWIAGDGFFVATEFAVALLLVAAAIAALTTRFLPAWLAWLSLLIAVVLVIPPIGWAALIFAFPIWILLVTYFLWRRAETAPDRPLVEPGAQAR